jgi:hypothetical protein
MIKVHVDSNHSIREVILEMNTKESSRKTTDYISRKTSES